ncbi:phage virion morphogenesis protein [Mesorhizobium sp. AR07]|uniref:phage virion morphogenesis protein n=1 Tax=Mesorhizobium sp. AR07 TaxID=2865838 RepID=UPI002160DCE9|nr:phage virion morphogenesis protein [Mesorhizobium sp. AR07]UVK45366.1 phage virion morphogenesis protein [Mesorhizobium sp. AR07]
MADGIKLVLNDKRVLARLDQLARAAENPAGAMEAIGLYMVGATQRRFQRETGPDGQKWQRLSARTANRRVGRSQRGYGHILRLNLRLYSSIAYLADPDRVEIGTNMAYAAAHQLGAEIKIPAREQDIHLGDTNRGKRFVKASRKRKQTLRVKIGGHTITIPARPYLGVDTEDQAEILAIAEDFLRTEAGEQ